MELSYCAQLSQRRWRKRCWRKLPWRKRWGENGPVAVALLAVERHAVERRCWCGSWQRTDGELSILGWIALASQSARKRPREERFPRD